VDAIIKLFCIYALIFLRLYNSVIFILLYYLFVVHTVIFILLCDLFGVNFFSVRKRYRFHTTLR